MIFFQYGAFSIFSTREEAERLATDRWEQAQRAAEIYNDKELCRLPLPEFLSQVVTPVEIDADLLYSHKAIGAWSVWSDGQIRPLGLKEVYRPINKEGQPENFLMSRSVPVAGSPVTKEAASFIDTVRGSDSESPAWLGRVRHVVSLREGKSESKSGGYAGPALSRLRITLDDGTTIDKTVLSEGYPEGYVFEIFDTDQAALRSRSRRNWIGTECFECGAVYDQPGFVEPGEMGCDRCNSAETNWQAHTVG